MKAQNCKVCKPVFWKHEDGWDVFKRSDCTKYEDTWMPNWFDCQIIEDAKTKKEAIYELEQSHFLGMCLV